MTFDNSTSNAQWVVGEGDDSNSHRNEMSMPVICLCTRHCVCGCKENHNKTYEKKLIDNSTEMTAGSDKQFLSATSNFNGMKAMVVNGTLDNGTTADGGTFVPPSRVPPSLLADGGVVLGRNWGTFVVGLVVVAMVHL